MKLQEKQTIHGFAVDRSRYVPELHSQAYELHHIQSGARLLYIQNDDDNKVFPFLSGRRRLTARAYPISANILPFAAPGSSPSRNPSSNW